MNVLFVCFGNICRSPMAEGIAKALIRGQSTIRIKSAGLHAIPGNRPSEKAARVCRAHGVDISSHRAQLLSPVLLTWADLIFCMERYQCLEIREMVQPTTDIRLIGEGIAGVPDEIPDPYGLDMGTYEQTFQSLTRAITVHLGHLRERRKHDRKAEASG